MNFGNNIFVYSYVDSILTVNQLNKVVCITNFGHFYWNFARFNDRAISVDVININERF